MNTQGKIVKNKLGLLNQVFNFWPCHPGIDLISQLSWGSRQNVHTLVDWT